MTTDTQNRLNTAQGHQRAGALPQAEALCREIVRDAPECSEAWNLLGIIAHQSKKMEQALDFFGRAQASAPTVAAYHNNRATILTSLGRFAEAEREYRDALRLAPNEASAHFDFGNLLQELRRYEEAAASYRRALTLKPDYLEAHYNLAAPLRELRCLAEAEECYRRTLQAIPNFPEAHYNLANVLRDAGRLDEAETSYRHALQLRPNYLEALSSLGTLLEDFGQYHAAAACFRQTFQIRPDYAEAHGYLAMQMLRNGDFKNGFAEYEWRLNVKGYQLPRYAQPLWDGSALTGRTILLHPEQGSGDTIHFIRYAALLKQRGATVLCHCPPSLLGLLRTCPGVDRLIPTNQPPPAFDTFAPLLSLPRLFDTTIDTIPASIPYLDADQRLVARWRTRLAQHMDFRVGIVWQGSGGHKKDRFRSAPLANFEMLSRLPGVHLFSLQIGPGREQLAAISSRFRLTDLGGEFNPESFDDVAAVMKNLDLVITVDSGLAHLAGALGVRVWTALAYVPDWRWLHDRSDSPWYPTMRLFRQPRLGDWDDVFTRMAQELRRELPKSPQQILARATRFHTSGDVKQAEALCLQLVRDDPGYAEAWNLLGLLAHQVGNKTQALSHFEHATTAAPAVNEYRGNRAAVLEELGRLEDALLELEEVRRLTPNDASVHYRLGNVLRNLDRYEEAIAAYRRALQLLPDYPEAHYNLAAALRDLYRFDEAVECYQRTLRFMPNFPEAYNNLGGVYRDMWRLEDAEANYGLAVQLRPNDADFHHNRSLFRLLAGDYERGWSEYEWRWQIKGREAPYFRQPLWDGSPLHGRTILLYMEQGLGDTIQFIRYAGLVKERGARVLFGCPKPLFSFLRSCRWIDELVSEGAPLPQFDVQCPLMSLPRLFNTTLDTVPAPIPYLAADPNLVERWRKELADYHGFKVGIVWQGNPGYSKDRFRSAPLAEFAPLSRVENVQLFSLQVGPGHEQLEALGEQFGLVDLGSRFDATSFDDAAAVVNCLDLVITVDSSITHVAASQGLPVWVALCHTPDWRWLLKRDDSPWYPTVKLFRQSRPGDWSDVFERVAQVLAEGNVSR